MPLGPDFEDPPKSPNYLPYFVTGDPFFERTITAPQDFSITIKDPNPQDRLYVRWVADYPLFMMSSTRLLQSEDGLPGGVAVPSKYSTLGLVDMVQRDCALFTTGPNHRLVVIVSDRPFAEPGVAPSRDYRYNGVVPPDSTIPIMAGWNIVCPQQ